MMKDQKDITEQLDRIEQQIHSKADEPLSIEAAAKYIHLSKSHLYKLTSKKKIKHYKPGKRLIFKKSDLDEWLFSRPVKTQEQISRDAAHYKKGKVVEGWIGRSR